MTSTVLSPPTPPSAAPAPPGWPPRSPPPRRGGSRSSSTARRAGGPISPPDEAAAVLDPDLHADLAGAQVWLLSWLPQQGTPLHDHGTSAGAFSVVRGTLTERVLASGRTRSGSRSPSSPRAGCGTSDPTTCTR